ncbi:hypothetical protein A1D22_07625 [Pasteurellaceae bacterium LFhippo2]|nr:hypothetical protein [Pasteurellaceae bacterium LFhippo2]
MWQSDSTTAPIRIDHFQQLADEIKSLPNFDKNLTANIRICVPQLLLDALEKQITLTINAQNISEVIRDILLKHCYGVATINYLRKYYLELELRKQQDDSNLLEDEIGNARISFRPQISLNKPNLGKNLHIIKFSCHSRLKEDLLKLSQKDNTTLSEYIRRLLISKLLGKTFLFEYENIQLIERYHYSYFNYYNLYGRETMNYQIEIGQGNITISNAYAKTLIVSVEKNLEQPMLEILHTYLNHQRFKAVIHKGYGFIKCFNFNNDYILAIKIKEINNQQEAQEYLKFFDDIPF